VIMLSWGTPPPVRAVERMRSRSARAAWSPRIQEASGLPARLSNHQTAKRRAAYVFPVPGGP
jgi:hypothetical protein